MARRAAGRVATLGEGANFGEKDGGNLVGEEASAVPNSKGKSLHKVDGLIKILYISEEEC